MSSAVEETDRTLEHEATARMPFKPISYPPEARGIFSVPISLLVLMAWMVVFIVALVWLINTLTPVYDTHAFCLVRSQSDKTFEYTVIFAKSENIDRYDTSAPVLEDGNAYPTLGIGKNISCFFLTDCLNPADDCETDVMYDFQFTPSLAGPYLVTIAIALCGFVVMGFMHVACAGQWCFGVSKAV